MSVVVGDQRTGDRAPVLLLWMAAAMARMRWAMRMATPSKVRPPLGFQVELAFEGVVESHGLTDQLCGGGGTYRPMRTSL
jgi:hypothetical protein